MVSGTPDIDAEEGREAEKAAGKREALEELLRSRHLLVNSLVLFFLYLTNGLVYYGFTLNTESFIPGDLHFNFVVGGVLEVAAYSVTIVGFLFFGRRYLF